MKVPFYLNKISNQRSKALQLGSSSGWYRCIACIICMHHPPPIKITITTRDVSRPRGKVCCWSFVIDLYCRHFVPYLVLALIINHCFNKLRLSTQQPPHPTTQCWITENIWWLCCRGNNLSCSGKSKQRVFFFFVRQTQTTVQHLLSDNISTRSRA